MRYDFLHEDSREVNGDVAYFVSEVLLITSQLVADDKQWQRTTRPRAKPIRSDLKIINILTISEPCLDKNR